MRVSAGASLIAATALGALFYAAADRELVGRAEIVDGDTIRLAGERVRFHGVDAPELGQTCSADGQVYACGREAAAALSKIIAGRPIRCRDRGRDRHGRVLATCRLESGQDIEAALVLQGWALAFRRYSMAYVSQENEARAARRGMWAGQFTAPWDWRPSERAKP